jgi:hypothetical protein
MSPERLMSSAFDSSFELDRSLMLPKWLLSATLALPPLRSQLFLLRFFQEMLPHRRRRHREKRNFDAEKKIWFKVERKSAVGLIS